MALLRRGLADVELPRLAVMVGEALGPQPHLLALFLGREVAEALDRRFTRALAPGIRLVVDPADRIAHRHVPVLLEMGKRTFRRIDRDMGEVRSAETLQLGIEIGEVAALQQRIVGEVDARGHVLRHERHLLGLGEEIVRHAIEHQSADRLRRQDFLGNDLRRIEHVEIEAVGEGLVEQLHLQFPFREVARLDRLPEIAAMEIRIGAVDLHRLVPRHRLQAELRLPVELHEGRLILSVDEAERMDTETFHETERSRNGAIRHGPHDHVHAFRRQRNEVPEVVVCRLRLGEIAVRLLFGGMDKVGKLDGILDEEDRDIVADEIPIALLGIDLDRKAANIPGKVERALVAGNRGEADEGGGLFTFALEEIGLGVGGKRIIGLEITMGAIAARMNDAFRDALMVEMEQLFAEMEIIHGERPARADTQRILVVGDRSALRRGHHRCIMRLRGLVQLTAGASHE